MTVADDGLYLAKDAVTYRCAIKHTVTSSDGTVYPEKQLLLDAVSTGCGAGEYLGDTDRGALGTRCVCSPEFYFPRTADCAQCPDQQSTCPTFGLEAPVVRAGWWRENLTSPDPEAQPFYRCPFPKACRLEGAVPFSARNRNRSLAPGSTGERPHNCAPGHFADGPMCATCAPGYVLSAAGACSACQGRDDTSQASLSLYVAVAVCALVYMAVLTYYYSRPALVRGSAAPGGSP